jgi:TrmH family RNA methyltransferase
LGCTVEFSAEDVLGGLKNIQNSAIPTVMILDDVSDPGNVGTLIRTADWFGLAGIVCSARSADIWNPKTIQSSMGSVFRIPICTAKPLDVIKRFSLKAVALDARGDNFFESTLVPDAIVIGSESHGLSDGLIDVCEATWSIPGKGNAESLNAAIAGAIVTSELSRRLSALGL